MYKYILLSILSVLSFSSFAGTMPKQFVYLKDIDPTIQQDMRYAGRHNFIGRPIKGYEASECILTKEAATALANVQKKLKSLSLSLTIYDCYRPQVAVDDFISWSKLSDQQQMKNEFYPNVDKADLFKLGYIAEKSGHTRGSTVDLTITGMDMGSGYDYMDLMSHGDNTNVGSEAYQHRQFLQSVMEDNGFVPYPFEWWHFTLRNEPYPENYFNFKIEKPLGFNNPPRTTKQVIVVQPDAKNATIGALQLFERESAKQPWKVVGSPVRVVIGKNGVTTEALKKREGDLKTPSGIYKIGPAFGFSEKPDKNVKLPYLPITNNIVCVDDPQSRYYNKFVDQSKVSNRDWMTAESMREQPLYKQGVVISYNTVHPTRGAGSCIFFHVWRDEQSGTAGCVAMKEKDLTIMMKWLDSTKKPMVVILPQSHTSLLLSARSIHGLSPKFA